MSMVSIHVPLAEHDRGRARYGQHKIVSIHVPLAEHDLSQPATIVFILLFQFTCPSRSTTY